MEMLIPEITGSPAYIFDLDQFAAWCARVKDMLGDIPLTYSMKANPFLLNGLSDAISHVEVCSPGELTICEKMGIAPERIIYSGVMKEQKDVEEAVSYGVDLLTAESLLHVELENEAVVKLRTSSDEKRKVLLRLTNGSQFGMSVEDMETIIANKERYEGLDFYGIHYFSGTQKKLRQVQKDVQRVKSLLEMLKSKYDYEPRLVEYGPGAPADYFEEPYEEIDEKNFRAIREEIRELNAVCPVGIEMGRFLASGCGHFITRICDSKVNSETNYLICDGGINHLNYYGQNMAMQIPPMELVDPSGHAKEGETLPYMICGSLCTMADILVREVELPKAEVGDHLIFHRCGAYSVTEGILLFLSRTMPRIYLYTQKDGLVLARDFTESLELNRKR